MKRGKGVSRTFYDTINKRARKSFPMDLLKSVQEGSSENNPNFSENYSLWEDHWLKTAQTIREELNAEKLPHTVRVLDEIIAENEAYIAYRKREAKQKETAQ